MSELRHDPIQKRWVIVAQDRSLVPTGFEHVPANHMSHVDSPFRAGNELFAGDPIWRWPPEGDWRVRVVPNRFPALAIEGDLLRSAEGHYDKINGVGAHEVIIETPCADESLAQMPVEHVYGVMLAWRERLRDLVNDPRLRYVLIFKNHGLAAGASHQHSHSQLIATPITPRTVAMELQSAREHFLLKERCLFCDLLSQEFAEQKRIVAVDEHFVTICPYASRFPFEMHLMPRVHAHDMRLSPDTQLQALARHLKGVLGKMRAALGDPAYNLVLHNAPNPRASTVRPTYWTTLEADWHWHIEILPRLRRVAGFEWGTGFYINPTAPEDAARVLREAQPAT